jgi:uncharacterized protein
MKKITLILLLLVSFAGMAQVEKYIPDPPVPPRLVNDMADMLTPEQEQYLERKLVAYDDSTSSQILIATVKDLHGYAAVDYAVALGRKWGVGGAQFNNGVIILVSTGGEAGDRDAFIATGYGLEGAIPDITANQILERELIPGLVSGNYYQGFERTVDALILAAAGEYKAPEGYRDRGKGGGGGSISKIIIVIIIIIIIMSMSGGGGNKGGGFMSRRGYRGGLWGPTIFGTGMGSGGFGGGGFGGGGGGGGFGGFGGGGFGGGGAGGNW